MNDGKSKTQREKILLVLFPFWSPLIPPLGISCLSGFLQKHGYYVKTLDANTEDQFREIYNNYFAVLRDCVPEKQWGNFYSVGHDVLQNHMMAFFNHDPGDERKYQELVKILVYKSFYININDKQMLEFDQILSDFYLRLENYFIQWLEREKPSILGLSVYSGTLPASIFIAKITRQKYPHIKIIMGGGVFSDQLDMGTENFQSFLEKTNHYIDKIIIGEGEVLFLKFLRGELPESKKTFTLHDINGEILDLSAADLPVFSDLEVKRYPELAAYASRSCPFQCSFCSETVQWGKYRKKNAKQVVAELTELYRRHNYPLFFMSDSLLDPLITDIANEFIYSGVSIYWDACIRAHQEACDMENTILWRQGGFYRARLGLESGSPQVLRLMNKKISIEQIKKSVKNLALAGIKTSTLWLIGHPGETEEDFQQTLDLIEELKEYIYEAEGTPFWYHPTGQSRSGEWGPGTKNLLLYPGEAKDMLISQTWILDGQPDREEIYKRLHRFTRHINKLGIPNAYTLQEFYQADERWKMLHKNAVPSLAQLTDGNYPTDECKKVKNIKLAEKKFRHDDNWGF